MIIKITDKNNIWFNIIISILFYKQKINHFIIYISI
jgi:hypothetical protein